MPTLRIVADENIPLVRDLFGSIGDVRVLPGGAITRENVGQADVLLVRSVTQVDADLLGGTDVRFVGTATTGTDHIETEYLHQHEIAWASAPGSNAESVVEYVLSALLRLAVRRGDGLNGKTIGIIGCGNVGGRLAVRASALGMTVLKNDPPLAREEEASGRPHAYLPLEELLASSDVVTCHVPLTMEGPYKTWHLLGRQEIAALVPGAWLINTARGPVVDSGALLQALRHTAGGPGAVVLDVWEHEPAPSAELIEQVDIATPHIAGYSYEGKVAGTLMLLDALAEHLAVATPSSVAVVDTSEIAVGAPDPGLPETDWLHNLACRMYDVAADDHRMRGDWPASDDEAAIHFTRLRRTYPHRRTFRAYHLRERQVPAAYRQAAAGVGVRLDRAADYAR